jgi:hypothetical protein
MVVPSPLGLLQKVKVTLVHALRLCTGRTAHRGSRGIALLFHDHGTSRGWGVSVTPWPLFTPGKDPVPIVQESVWAPWPVWTGVKNLAPQGFDFRTVQPVTSRYTDWASQPTWVFYTTLKLFCCSIWPSQEGAENKGNEYRQESYATVNSLGRDKVHRDVSYSHHNR